MMPSTDRLSDLPENVMNAILMPLSLQEAVRTSILSNKWRYKWCRLPQLTLDDYLWEDTNNLLSPSTKFTNIMYRILTHHSGPLTKFTLSVSALKKYHMIGSLIYFLSRNDIQHLVLRFSEWNRYKLPPSFFTCSQLRHLTLKNCVVCPPPGFKGFDMLISLELCDVTISTELLESLISYSPLLENLVLEISDAFTHIQISASKLRTFDFAGCIKFISLDAPLLAKLSLSYHRSDEKFEICDLDNLFHSLPSLEHLRLKHLCLEIYGPVDPVGIDEKFSDVTLNKLRTVKLEAQRCIKLLMPLIKHVLAKSPVLVRMLILPYESYEDYEDYEDLRDKIRAELTEFHRASPTAEVVVPEEDW